MQPNPRSSSGGGSHGRGGDKQYGQWNRRDGRPQRREQSRDMNQGYNPGNSFTPPGISPPSMPDPTGSLGGGDGGVPVSQMMFPAAPYYNTSDVFMHQQLRQQMTQQTPPPPASRVVTVASPKFAHYHTITTIDGAPMESVPLKLMTQLYRATNRYNGKEVHLRRVVNHPMTPSDCTALCESLRHFRHPNLVPIHSIVATQDFVLGSQDIIIESRYIRQAKTLNAHFIANENSPTCPESLLWSIACQLMGLLRTFHDAGCSLRGLHHSKILFVESTGRVLFSGLGLQNIVDPRPGSWSLAQQQRRDIGDLGLVLLRVAVQNGSVNTMDALQRYKTFSPNLKRLIAAMRDQRPLNEVSGMMGDRMAMELGHQLGVADYLLQECSKEVHNGRLMRLLVKMNFVMAAIEHSEEWAETQPLRLFFHYLFNQVDEQSRPRLDWGHVHACLNKLDLGTEELVQLISHDHGTLLVVSYKDMKTLFESMFSQLQAAQAAQSASAMDSGATQNA